MCPVYWNNRGYKNPALSGWDDSPCFSCPDTPCCRYLPLHSFFIRCREDWRTAENLLAVPGIRLGLKDNGSFLVYLHRSCRFLAKDRRCRIHGTPEQSYICRDYNPRTCWYKRAFPGTATDLLILLDAPRLARLGPLIGWTGDGMLDRVPDWRILKREALQVPLTDGPSLFPGEGPPGLLVPPGKPSKPEHFDLIRFRLGFPGVFLVVGEQNWASLILPEGQSPEGPAAGNIPDPFGTDVRMERSLLIGLESLTAFQDACSFGETGLVSPHRPE